MKTDECTPQSSSKIRPSYSIDPHLAIAMQHAKMLYWEYDVSEGVAYCSPMVQDRFGIPEVLKDYPACYLKRGFVSEEDSETYLENCRSLQQGADYVEFDVRVRTLQKDFEWMRIRMSVLHDAQYDTVRAVCTAEHIAEYKELEQRFSTTLHQNDIASWRYDIMRHTIILNQNTSYKFHQDANREIFNIPESQIQEGLCHPEDVDTLRRLYRKLDEGALYSQEQLRFLDASTHTFRWKKCIYTVLTDDRGKPTYAIGTSLDITEQLEAQRQYRTAVEYRKHTQTENLLISGHCNVTKNRILEVTDLTRQNLFEQMDYHRDAFFAQIRSFLCSNPQKISFDRLFTNESIIRRFKRGLSESTLTGEICLDGIRRIWVSIHVSIIRSPDTGDLEGFLTVNDITESHVQEQLLNTVLACDYDYIARINFSADTIVLYQKNTNDRQHREYLSGIYYSYSTFLQRALDTMLEPEDAALFRQHMAPDYVKKQLRETLACDFICHIHEEDGGIRAKRARFAAYDPVSNTVSFSLADVTELIQQEDEKQSHLQSVLDEALRSSQIITSVAEHDFDYVMVVDIPSDRYRLYSGFDDISISKIPVIGCYSQQIIDYAHQYVLPEDWLIATEEMTPSFLEHQLAAKPEYISHIRLTEVDGSIRYKRVKFSYLDKRHTQLLVTRADVTDLILDEEKKREKLSKALNAAEQATQAKTDFLSRMSHDLRTPMNAIIGLSTLTIDDAENPELVRDNMTKMRYASKFMLGLINDILDMAKIESGAVTLTKEPYAYQDFVINMRTMFQAQCNDKGISFSMPDPTYNPVAYVDKVRINQIFFNILSNAVKYTPPGGKITYHIQNLSIADDHASGDCVISDTGIGMSDAFQKHMFEPFVQESNKITPELQGTGLGLSITKQLVELMGGAIHIDSKQGVGTTVTVHMTFELLSLNAALPSTAHKATDYTTVLAGRTVLLAEDHPLNAQIAQRLLEKQKICVFHAENGRIAVEQFAATDISFFDAVLMDIRMPEMDGNQASEAIRSLNRPDAATVPIIAMTANAYSSDVAKSKAAGMNAHLAKPIEPVKLYQVLAEQIIQHQKHTTPVLTAHDQITNDR